MLRLDCRRNAEVTELDNGMTVILLEDRNFPVVSVQMLYTVGARNESYGETRGSGVLRLTGDGWKIEQYVLSFAVPNDKARQVVEVIRGAE